MKTFDINCRYLSCWFFVVLICIHLKYR